MTDDKTSSYRPFPIPTDWASVLAGLLITFVAPLLALLEGSPTPWLPWPIYVLAFVWHLGPLGLVALPLLFLLQRSLLEERFFAATQFGATCVLCLLEAWYLVYAYPDGLEWQGPSHTRIVLAGNVVASVLLTGSAFIAWRRSSRRWVLLSNLALFLFLSWYAFPYMGEQP